MQLDELADLEERLMDALPDTKLFEERVPAIEAALIPEQWRDIVDCYVVLFDDPVAGPEALRRAVFIVWTSWNEPWALSGIRKLSHAAEQRVLARVDFELAHGASDRELSALLRSFGNTPPFDRNPQCKALTAFFAMESTSATNDVPEATFTSRGALGRHWRRRR